MDFYQKYELIDPLPGEGTRSFRARQAATGKEVVVHLLVGGRTPENEKLLGRLRGIPALSFSKLVEIGDNEGTPFVVTAAPPYLHLAEWLADQERSALADSQKLAHAGTWRVPVAPPGVGGTQQMGSAPAPPSPPPAAPPAQQPGEFTRLFQTGAGPTPQNTGGFPQPAPKSAAPPAAPAAQQPGEFTRMFQTGASPASQNTGGFPQPAPKGAAPPAAPAAQQPGEFTRMFQTGASPAPQNTGGFPQPAPKAAAPPAPPAAQQPGEFTRMFQTGASPAPQNTGGFPQAGPEGRRATCGSRGAAARRVHPHVSGVAAGPDRRGAAARCRPQPPPARLSPPRPPPRESSRDCSIRPCRKAR